MYGQINRAQKAKRLYQARAAVQKMERAVADFRQFTMDANGGRPRKDAGAVSMQKRALASIKTAALEAKAALEPIADAEELEDSEDELTRIAKTSRTEDEARNRIAKFTATAMIRRGQGGK